MDYRAYLASREFGLLREATKRRAGGLCEHCKIRPDTETHHLTYAHVGHESLDELLRVCSPCHRYLSGRRKADPAYVEGVEELEQKMARIREDLAANPSDQLLRNHHALALRRVALLEEAGARAG